jgi:iron complex transport system substrate-binding protein
MSLTASPSAAPPARTVSVTLLLVIVLVVAGAAVAATAGYYALQPSSTPGSLTVVDDLGRTVTVPRDPGRLVVLSPSIMDIVYRLGLRSHVVGVDCYASAFGGIADDYSPDQIALWNLTPSMCVQIGPTFAPETLLNLTPQLVLASTIVSVAAVEEISTEFHIPVVMLQPPTLSGVLVDDSLVGEIFGVSTAADQLNGLLSVELYNATVATEDLTAFPTVLVTYDVDANGYWTFGPGTFGESLIEICGGSSISANATIPYPELSPAQVLVANPQWIVYGVGFGLNESTYAGGPYWSDFNAVKDGNVTGIDSNWLTEPDPTMILAGIPALLAIFAPGGA